MNRATNRRIDARRLWDSLMEMARIGATPKGGVRRLALSDKDREARDLFRHWCEREGLSVRVDAIGNMFARREGRIPRARRSCSAATWTASRPGASSTARSACSRGWRSCAR